MTLTLYNNTNDPRVVNKSLSQIGSATIRPTSSLNVYTPTFIIDYNANYINANYCYCDTLKRFYYINDMSLEIGKIITFGCNIDVLNTYKSELSSCECVALRNEGIGKPTRIPDTKLPIDPNEQVVTSIRFKNSPFDNTHSASELNLLLTVLKGG